MKILAIALILVLGSFLSVSAQATNNDSQIKAVCKGILRDYFGKIANTSGKTIEVRVIIGSPHLEVLPNLPNVKFLMVSEGETKNLGESERGVDFYEITLSSPDEDPWLSITKAFVSRCYRTAFSELFEPRQVRGKWKVGKPLPALSTVSQPRDRCFPTKDPISPR